MYEAQILLHAFINFIPSDINSSWIFSLLQQETYLLDRDILQKHFINILQEEKLIIENININILRRLFISVLLAD